MSAKDNFPVNKLRFLKHAPTTFSVKKFISNYFPFFAPCLNAKLFIVIVPMVLPNSIIWFLFSLFCSGFSALELRQNIKHVEQLRKSELNVWRLKEFAGRTF